ncbi:MAG: hypothetical protein HY074_13640 [Deltaproteobacteria bacterium]|nr:hypothetical protein [Deltaproteobacteria bacterium]
MRGCFGVLMFSMSLSLLVGCVSKPIVRPREVVGHAITHDTVVLLSRNWLPDGTLQYGMAISIFPEDFLSVKAGQNLELFVDGHRYWLALRTDSNKRPTADPATAPALSPEYVNFYQRASAHHSSQKVETLLYDGLPPDFLRRVAHASSVQGTINGSKESWSFEFTQVLLRQFYDWSE